MPSLHTIPARTKALARALRSGLHPVNLLRHLGLPALGLVVFMALWQMAANRIETSLGQFPGPVQVLQQVRGLYAEYLDEKEHEKAFYERQYKRIAERRMTDPDYPTEIRPYTGKPTFLQQVATSLKTVFTGFLLASLVAIPLGILIGLSSNVYLAVNPLIQLFKPISPLAWLPLVTIAVSALYHSDNPALPRSYITSAMTVMLCSLWPTLLNTAMGVTSVSRDLVDVSRVLRLGWFTHVRKIVLPSAIPMMFTGLRLSLGIAWMVLIAAEMLAQNPGLGKFVWDEFQNGSSESLGRIMVAVLSIGLIGFMLDRLMLVLQRRVAWDKTATIR